MKEIGATVSWCRIWVICKSSLSSGWSGWLVERLSSMPGVQLPEPVPPGHLNHPGSPKWRCFSLQRFCRGTSEEQTSEKTAYWAVLVQLSFTSAWKRWFYRLARTSGGRIIGKHMNDISTCKVTWVSWENGLSRLECSVNGDAQERDPEAASIA